MKWYDITQEVFSSCVYPGDRTPERLRVFDMEEGALYNLTEFAMNAHNGTHVDAPRHFIRDGKTVEELDPTRFFGTCTVRTFPALITKEDLIPLVGRGIQRLLCKGNSVLTLEAAKMLPEMGIRLIGVEPQSIAEEGATMAVHLAVLEAEILVLEGLRLSEVPDGEYFLAAAPMKLGGSDGAPCRAFLLDGEP